MISSALILFLFLSCNYKNTAVLGFHKLSATSDISQSRYAIVVDAGSSGSRLFVYCFPPHKSDESILPPITLCSDSQGNPLTKKVNPGLSSFASTPSSSEAYITDLLSFAAQNIHKRYHSITPVYILATAGMRLLPESQQDAIWKTVRTTVKKQFTFKFDDSWAQTVSGYFEALYGWITVNYLLGNLAEPPRQTVGMLDMGGASMQIAYEVPLAVQPPENLILPFTIGGKRTYRVYVMTFLGYGTQAAKSRYKSLLLHNAMEYSRYSSLLKLRYRPSTGYLKPPTLSNLTVQFHYTMEGDEKFILSDPCLQPGLEDTLNARDLVISRTLLATGNSSSPIITFLGTGDLPLCIAYQKSLLQKHKPCRLNPCSMNGIHQPQVNFENLQFYAMSEYWYTFSGLGTPITPSYEFDTFYASALNICKEPWYQSLLGYRANHVVPSDISNKQNVCFKASWIINVLHSGFGFAQTYANLHPIDKLSGIEVQWSLGAFIYHMQESNFESLFLEMPNEPVASFAHRQTGAVIFLFLVFLCLSTAAYCIYCRRRQRFNFGGGRSVSACCAAPLLRPFKWLWPKLSNNGLVASDGSGVNAAGIGGGMLGVGSTCRRNPSGNYPYLKIASPSLLVNFRSSTSLPSFEAFQNTNTNAETNAPINSTF